MTHVSIVNYGGIKGWFLALCIVFRMLFMRNTKIVIAGVTFRHAKRIFKYIEHIWKTTSVFHGVDKCTMIINSNVVVAMPICGGVELAKEIYK